jgi:hypothetical protein
MMMPTIPTGINWLIYLFINYFIAQSRRTPLMPALFGGATVQLSKWTIADWFVRATSL